MSCNNSQDNPCNDEDFDGTDAACPAWWRGLDRGINMTAQMINQVLDKLEQGNYDIAMAGRFSSDELNKLRDRIKKLYMKEGSMKKEILVKVNVGKHKRGDPYPQIDFSDLTCAGVYNKSGAVAYSQETLENQIDNMLTRSPDTEEISYFYYTLSKTLEEI